MKITIDYDPVSGCMTDANGMTVGTYIGVKPLDDPPGNKTDELIKLKSAGFTAEEILQLKSNGAI